MAERAGEALNNPNADGKRDAALAYARKRKDELGDGIFIQGSFHNATGATVTYFSSNSRHGKVDGNYPISVNDGETGHFFYVETTPGSGCEGFVVYRVTIDGTKVRNLLIAWSDQVGQKNLAYCDIFDDDKVDPPDVVYKKMVDGNNSEWVVNKLGMMVTSQIGSGTYPEYVAEFTRENVEASKST